MKPIPTFVLVALLSITAQADAPASAGQSLAHRRSEYVQWIATNFGRLEPEMDPRDGRLWALNHARLELNRDLDKANAYFETFGPLPRDADIYFIRFLKTLLDFRDSPRLSEEAESHIVEFLKGWPRNELSSIAHWPPRHTENHDLMHLTIGMFAQQYRGADISGHIRQIRQFIAWRLQRGFVEWNSKCYQFHFSNPLIVLVDHAPDDDLRRGAQTLLNVLLGGTSLAQRERLPGRSRFSLPNGRRLRLPDQSQSRLPDGRSLRRFPAHRLAGLRGGRTPVRFRHRPGARSRTGHHSLRQQ